MAKRIACDYRSGFTLIELIITIAVLSVIVVVSVSVINPVGQFKKARDGRRRADLEDIRSGLEMYRTDCGHYPADAVSGATIMGDGGAGCPNTVEYLTIPLDPQSPDRQYVYDYDFDAATSTTDEYALCAALEGEGSLSTGAKGTCTVAGACGEDCNYDIYNP